MNRRNFLRTLFAAVLAGRLAKELASEPIPSGRRDWYEQLDPDLVAEYFAKDAERIADSITESLSRPSPWLTLIQDERTP